MRYAPYLDNIETSGTSSQTPKPLTNNAFEPCNNKKVYSKSLDEILGDLEENKKISVETAVSLIDFGNDLDWKTRGRTMYNCGDSVTYSDGKIVAANFCRQRLCPMCQRRKSLKTYSDFCKILDELSDFSFLHLVLTVPNVKADSLTETLEQMNKCSSRFFKIKELRESFRGVARFTELTYNAKNEDFHPHFHCLVAVNKSYFTSRKYLKYEFLRFLWSAVWHFRYDNLKRLSDKKIKLSNLLDSDMLQIFITKADKGALPEIAKYAVKPLSFQASRKKRAEILQTIFEALHGKRLVQTFGVIKEAAKKAKVRLDDDVVELDTLENSDTIAYNYNHSLSRYERIELD